MIFSYKLQWKHGAGFSILFFYYNHEWDWLYDVPLVVAAVLISFVLHVKDIFCDCLQLLWTDYWYRHRVSLNQKSRKVPSVHLAYEVLFIPLLLQIGYLNHVTHSRTVLVRSIIYSQYRKQENKIGMQNNKLSKHYMEFVSS